MTDGLAVAVWPRSRRPAGSTEAIIINRGCTSCGGNTKFTIVIGYSVSLFFFYFCLELMIMMGRLVLLIVVASH